MLRQLRSLGADVVPIYELPPATLDPGEAHVQVLRETVQTLEGGDAPAVGRDGASDAVFFLPPRHPQHRVRPGRGRPPRARGVRRHRLRSPATDGFWSPSPSGSQTAKPGEPPTGAASADNPGLRRLVYSAGPRSCRGLPLGRSDLATEPGRGGDPPRDKPITIYDTRGTRAKRPRWKRVLLLDAGHACAGSGRRRRRRRPVGARAARQARPSDQGRRRCPARPRPGARREPARGRAGDRLRLPDAVRANGPSRSDTLMLVRVDPATKLISLLSLPRDLYVPINGVCCRRSTPPSRRAART